MIVFLCWSGDRSRAVAETLYFWLQRILPYVAPWFSEAIDGGDVWDKEIHAALDAARAGIVVLTAANRQNEKFHYEAGYLAGRGAKVYCYLVEGPPSKWPLGRLQARKADRKRTLRLIKELNKLAEPAQRLDEADVLKAFERAWPDLASVDTQSRPVVDR